MRRSFQSWGRYPHAIQRTVRLRDRHAGFPDFEGHGLPRGNGRSYGDTCLDDGGTLLDATGLDRFIDFDREAGVLRCEAGTLLGSILDVVVPAGWFLPVVPGTRLVTVGGAIANDVHGKNHHVAGSFGRHVRAFELLRSDGTRLLCSPSENAAWFAATIGGLGLTGLITWAELALQRVPGGWLDVETIRFERLADFFALSAASEPGYEYSVAWIDCAARHGSPGRGVFTHANHAAGTAGPMPPHKRRIAVPLTPPVSLVNRTTTRLFNSLHYHRAPKAALSQQRAYRDWLFPLDDIRDWNRIYGPKGFLQYQCILPPDDAERSVRELLDTIAAGGGGSSLAVLKQLGPARSPGLLSFPRLGTTLAVDFPNRGKPTLELLDRLDDLVGAAGGAVYPAKDARMSGDRFRTYFPAWRRFTEYLDPALSSGFWRRVMR